MPMAEKMAFILTTLLCDIAVLSDDYRHEIIALQIEVFQRLTESIVDGLKHAKFDQHKKGIHFSLNHSAHLNCLFQVKL